MARASILWLIGEYCERVPKIAPDVLRKMAKSFTSEEDIVKLQIVNLAAKLYLTNSKQVRDPRGTLGEIAQNQLIATFLTVRYSNAPWSSCCSFILKKGGAEKHCCA